MNRSKRLGIHLPLLILFIAASVTLRSVALFTQYNSQTGYFNDKLIISIANGISFAGVFILFSFIFISPKIKVSASFKGASTFIPSGMVSGALVFLALELVSLVASKPGDFFTLKTLSSFSNIFPLMTAALALASVIHFLSAVLYTDKENDRRALFGILTVIFLAFYALYLYFDTELPLNAPNKLVDMTAILITALFFLYETRISIGREIWRAYFAFALTASLVTAYSSIPTLIYALASGDLVSDSIAGAALTFTLCIYVNCRMFSVILLPEDKKSAEIAAIETIARKREEDLSLPDSARIDNKDDKFNTLGQNYEFDLSIPKKDGSSDEETE